MAREAANALKITGKDLLKYGIVDEVIKEPKEGIQNQFEKVVKKLKQYN